MKSAKEWISISDMMTGLMIVFLFISVLYMMHTQESLKEVEDIVKEHRSHKDLVAKKISEKFPKKDLEKWGAKIPSENPLVIRFLSPDIIFKIGSSVIRKDFKKILNNFCPKYFKLLYDLEEKNIIDEIRIEGHTSVEWGWALSDREAYFYNMELSQDRARAVLQYCVEVQGKDKTDKTVAEWAIKKLTANGLSSSRLICKENKDCHPNRNRRVEFSVQVNESDVLNAIFEKFKNLFFSFKPDKASEPFLPGNRGITATPSRLKHPAKHE